jgi:hypothetical protein
MADKKISELVSLTGANAATGDLIPIVDVSANETKKITREEFFTNIPSVSGTTGNFSGNFTVDTSTLFVDAANNRVGIGTNSPVSALTVNGLVTGTAVTQSTADVTPGRLMKVGDFGLGSSAQPILDFTSTEVNVSRIFRALSNATGGPSVDASFIALPFDGAPQTRFLGVDNNGVLRTGIKAGAAATPVWSFAYGPANISDIDATSNQVFRVNSAERMRITAAGSVGIGTSNPQSALHVMSATPALTVHSTATTGTVLGQKGNRLLLLSSSTTVANGGEIVWAVSDNDIGRWAAISGHINGNGSGNAGGSLVFATKISAQSSLTERVRVTDGGLVGIGTSNPLSLLHLSGSANAVLTLQAGSGSSIVDFTSGAGTQRIAGGLGGTNNLAFFTNLAERMRITSAGNVGIGKSNPGSRLAIVGLPTSSAGLTAGDIWNDNGTLKIV